LKRELETPKPEELIEGEKVYPIFRSIVQFTRDDLETPGHNVHNFMLPDVNADLAQGEDFAAGVWEKHLDQKIRHGELKGKTNIEANMQFTHMDTELIRHDVWLLTWFSHYTYNIHLTDTDLRTSFGRYVDRVGRFNLRNGHRAHDSVLDLDVPFVCVMGADERWRWKGPCKCQECVRNGLTRFDH